MITVLADKHRSTDPPSGVLVVENAADYVAARQHIRRALNQQHDLTIYIADPVLLRWCGDLQRYPTQVVRWRELDPLEAFAKYFGSEAASPFTPERIIALELETLRHVPDGLQVEPVGWILGERLGDLWRYEEPPADHPAQLAAWAAQQRAGLPSALLPLIETQLARWAEYEPNYRSLRAETLRADGRDLLIRAALQRYDAAWRTRQPWGQRPLLDCGKETAACIAALHGQRAAIETYWRQRFAESGQSAEVISAALHQMSGLSIAEMPALEMMLERHPTHITEALVTQIQQRFSQFPDAAPRLHELHKHIAPAVPPTPEAEWTSEQWLRWATHAYMPYFAWTVRYGHDRQHQQTCAALFSDWLHAQYPGWLNDDCAPLLLQQYQSLRALLDTEPDAVVVWLVVDNLTWWQGALLREACETHGFHTQRYEAGIAVLPSITSVSKRALVTGIPAQQDTRMNIAEAARDKLRRHDINGHVSYKFADALQIARQDDDTRCLIILFNMIDVTAHQMPGFSDDAGIRGHLAECAAVLQQLRGIYEAQGRSMHVLIGSDHGSTLLPAGARSLALPQTSQPVDDLDDSETVEQETQKPSTRAATVQHPERINAADRAAWYVLDRERFQLDQHYLVPRGYNYVGRRPSGWTHGGLTPEEVIVPLMYMTTAEVARLPLTVELSGQLEANQPATINATISNPNQFPIDALTLDVGRGAAPVQIERIAPLGRHDVAIEFPGVTDSASEVRVQWQLRFETASGAQMEQGQQTLAVRRLQTDDSGFDDLFTDS